MFQLVKQDVSTVKQKVKQDVSTVKQKSETRCFNSKTKTCKPTVTAEGKVKLSYRFLRAVASGYACGRTRPA